jgi:2,3-dimethylmalate lyase
MSTQREELRKLFNGHETFAIPGVYDVLGAKLVASLGFQAVEISGYGVSASLGFPDVGLITLDQMVQCTERIAGSVNIPVIADIDTGYGGIHNIMKTVRSFERAGAAGIHIEDQIFPKRCGSMKGKQVVPPEEMVLRIKAACEARTDPDFIIIARIDSIQAKGLEDGIERGNLYAAAGADALMPFGPGDLPEMLRYNNSVTVPTIMCNSETEKWARSLPIWPMKELKEAGFRAVLFPLATTFAAARAIRDVLIELKAKGTTSDVIETQMMNFHELNHLLGVDEIYRLDEKYRSTT